LKCVRAGIQGIAVDCAGRVYGEGECRLRIAPTTSARSRRATSGTAARTTGTITTGKPRDR
jgi:hypothetical protein